MAIYGERLKELMAERGENQGTLAAKSRVPQPTIQRILSGETRNPKGDTLRRLAAALQVDVSALTSQHPIPTGVSEPPPPPWIPLPDLLDMLGTRFDAAPESTKNEAVALIARYLERPESRPRIAQAIVLMLAPDLPAMS